MGETVSVEHVVGIAILSRVEAKISSALRQTVHVFSPKLETHGDRLSFIRPKLRCVSNIKSVFLVDGPCEFTVDVQVDSERVLLD